mmetsp:Transcript_22985/g.36713  ORF Transcript_22985/g.36713 Transcript_22985/m.36713 type:complete len:160 (-) Transcript_22985:151-630(-)|eukprot:CAMPEP_0169123552 /NCGR_PEP_ID=MMETSP1015-20121227/33848_1 /TAXON_ID=342587 /ORGANISM="Karlodinium micrum, Strain CCMP2283" /LENGTH=159 /DNA_ID=CAMNT_0009186901 /DNA_START=61 /DNA_END=540 /DNA_ORIENTATION=+
MALKPTVLWAQRPDSVYVTIDLKEVVDMKVALDAEKLTFSGKVEGNLYEFELEFSAKIKKEESKYSAKRLVEFYLKKEEDGSWAKLQKGAKVPWIQVDWKKWQDSDDEDDKGNFDTGGMGDMNFGDMMGGMGGMGGDEFDSDDEDLPDLEPSQDLEKTD